MSDRHLIDRLDDAIETLLAGGEAAVPSGDRRLAGLVRVALEVTGLPRDEFRTRLRGDLERAAARMKGGEEMETVAEAIREGFHTITPYLQVQRAADVLEFVKHAFGAIETFQTSDPGGGLRHAEARIGDSMVMLGGSPGMQFPERPASLHLYVPDADAVYERALQAGAVSLHEPVDQPYGDREGSVRDVGGNFWYIATHKAGAGHVPEGLRTVTPYLHPRGAAGLIDYLKDAFGAEEVARYQSPDGVIHHATVSIGDSALEMGEAHGPWQPMPPAIYLYVPDVDKVYERAVAAGGTSKQAPADQPYGDRNAHVEDPYGNTWYIATHKKDVVS
jgi:PhnB protein